MRRSCALVIDCAAVSAARIRMRAAAAEVACGAALAAAPAIARCSWGCSSRAFAADAGSTVAPSAAAAVVVAAGAPVAAAVVTRGAGRQRALGAAAARETSARGGSSAAAAMLWAPLRASARATCGWRGGLRASRGRRR